MAGNVTAQNTSLSGGSALTLQHSISQGADSPALVSQFSGRSGYAHDNLFFLLDSPNPCFPGLGDSSTRVCNWHMTQEQ